MGRKKSPTTPSKAPKLQRPPPHFRQPLDQWGDLQHYIRISRPQRVESHFSRYISSLKRLIVYGSEEETKVARALVEEVTIEVMRQAFDAVVSSRTESAVKASTSRFTKKAFTAAEKSLSVVSDRFLVEVTEAAGGNRGIDHFTDLPTSKGKAVWREEETEEAEESGTSASSDEIGESEEYDSVMESDAEEEAENDDDEDTIEDIGDDGDEDYHEGDLDVLALFFQFKRDNTETKYSLGKDTIADLASIGEFSKSLDLRTFQLVMNTLPKITRDIELMATSKEIMPIPETTFEEATKNVRSMDHLKDLVYLVSLCLDPIKFYLSPGEQAAVNERQYFVDLVLPCFRQMFWHFDLKMAILETQVLGCARRLNADRVPLVEKVLVADFADAVVTHNGVQPALAECGPPNESNQDKRYSDHYKLARDLKDTWAHCVDALIRSKKVPPTNLKVFGIQIFNQEVELYCFDFVGCFRLQQLTSFSISRRENNGFAEAFREMVVVCHGFAKMVAEEIKRWEQAPLWDDESDRRMAEKTLGYLPVTFPRPSKSLKRRCRRKGTDEDERGLNEFQTSKTVFM
ncbi:hypothetical protein CPB97_004272 [Podila verticillata]|nr:hypothetical protein CPB97_004272 [Podila verticillata]